MLFFKKDEADAEEREMLMKLGDDAYIHEYRWLFLKKKVLCIKGSHGMAVLPAMGDMGFYCSALVGALMLVPVSGALVKISSSYGPFVFKAGIVMRAAGWIPLITAVSMYVTGLLSALGSRENV